MKSRRDGNLLVVRLEDGEDLMSSLEKALSVNNVSSGIILTGIGMLRDFEIGYYDGKDYRRKRIKEPHELVALHGSIASAPADMRFHIHAALANPNHEIIGGHLFSATVGVVNEISILSLESVDLVRKKDEKTGLMLLDILD
jgi:predicted DNA-binding protein with PD1-like motif